MRVSYIHRVWPLVWRVALFVLIFSAIGEFFLRMHATDVRQTQEYIESGSPLVVVVDNPVVLDVVNHIVQGRSRVVMVKSVPAIDKSALRAQAGDQLMRARYIFFTMHNTNNAPSGSIVSLDDAINFATIPTATPQFVDVTTTPTSTVNVMAPTLAASSSLPVYGTDQAPEIADATKRYSWMSPDNAELMVGLIARTLGINDPINKTFFINNAYEYSSQIGVLYDNGYIPARMKGVPVVVVDGRYLDFAYDFGLVPRAVVDGPSFTDTSSQEASFDIVARAVHVTKPKAILVPDSFPVTAFGAYARAHHIAVPVVALALYPEQSDEGYLDILQYNILRLQNALL